MLKIFGLNGSRNFAKCVSHTHLDTRLSHHVEKEFADGEVYTRSVENVRGFDCYVINSLYGDNDYKVNEKILSLLIFIGSLKSASAERVTVVSPYLSYSRQDRKHESRAPITTKYIAKLMQAAGADRLLTMDIHNKQALDNAFDIPTDNLEAKNLFVEYITGIDRDGDAAEYKCKEELPENLVVISPDSGGMTRARRFRESLEKRLKRPNQIELAYLDKKRLPDGHLEGNKIIGDVEGKHGILIDDMIASGGTLKMCYDVALKQNCEIWCVCATHGLFVGNADDNLKGIPRIMIADTIPPFRLKDRSRLHVVKTAKMFAQAIKRTYQEGGSISSLLE